MARLEQILREEVEKYTGKGLNCFVYPVFDELRKTYAAVLVDYPQREATS